MKRWNLIESLLDKYDIKPIVGIIPNNQDEKLKNKYGRDIDFWHKVKNWNSKGWAIALHGYTHKCISTSGGINPVNFRSEFAGVMLKQQKNKVLKGIEVFRRYSLDPKIFFAPSHTFDMNTLKALKEKSNIRIICDTVANDIYTIGEFYFIPQQSGHVQNLPFKVTTFCYHPNNMSKQDFKILEEFIKKYKYKFGSFEDLSFYDRELSLYDKFLRKSYFLIRSVRNKLRGRRSDME